MALAIPTAVAFSIVFWWPLWTGGGLAGSDIYAYYLPQKAYYAAALRRGELPFWNNLIGHGYPQVAESQTGVFYPLHLAIYPWLDLNTAFSTSIIGHYILAFLLAGMYARRMGLALLGSGLTAVVYTYGWFPPRVCLEWSIIGGAWLPLALWCGESFLQTRHWRYAFLLTATLAVQMLGGHFTLAFITQLTLAAYLPLRLWVFSSGLPSTTALSRKQTCGGLALAVAAAFLVAAVQLLPTWELKQLSQREAVSAEHDPGYGLIPVRYLSQIALPWVWYPDESSFNRAVTPGGSRTNRVEAHLYFGLIPLALAVWRICRWRRETDARLAIWIILGIAALVYTTGCLLPVTMHLPGFSFFEGPGRFGVVTSLAVGLLAGSGLESLTGLVQKLCRSSGFKFVASVAAQVLVAAAVFGGTTFDLFIVSRLVMQGIVFLVQQPPIKALPDSPLRRVFEKMPQPARLFSEAKNLPSLLGVATIPTYLGLGPSQYFDPELGLPQPWPFNTPPTREQLDWLHRAGVTHFLSFSAIDRRAWSARLAWEGYDPFLNSALARPLNAPLYLYELNDGRGRVAWERDEPGRAAQITEYRANRVAMKAESPAGGRMVLTDLAYPGWQVTVDGVVAEPILVEKMFRGVDLLPGKHAVIWNYRPASLYWGAGISVGAVLVLLALAHVRYWHH